MGQRIGKGKKEGIQTRVVPNAEEACPRTVAKGTNLMVPTGPALDLPISPLLSRWSVHGCEVDCGPQWSKEAVEEAVLRGPHKGALDPDALELVHEDVAYQVAADFAEVHYWDEIKDALPPHLKISPVTVIPQKDRRGRIILDLSYPVYKRIARKNSTATGRCSRRQ